jgi:hypothetical protein
MDLKTADKIRSNDQSNPFVLEEEIKERRTILERTNVEIETINEYKQLKVELRQYHLSSEDVDKLVTVLNNVRHYGYDPKKIVAGFSNIKSAKRREKILKDHCQMLENRIADYREVLPHLQRIRSLGVGIYKLLPVSIAVNEKARASKLSISAAAYLVI